MTNPNAPNLLRGSMIADRTYLALQHYQHGRFGEEDKKAIKRGLDYIEKVRVAQGNATGKISKGFSKTGEVLRKTTYDLISMLSHNSQPNITACLDKMKQTLTDLLTGDISDNDTRIEEAGVFFKSSRDMLQSKAAGPMETVRIMEDFW